MDLRHRKNDLQQNLSRDCVHLTCIYITIVSLTPTCSYHKRFLNFDKLTSSWNHCITTSQPRTVDESHIENVVAAVIWRDPSGSSYVTEPIAAAAVAAAASHDVIEPARLLLSNVQTYNTAVRRYCVVENGSSITRANTLDDFDLTTKYQKNTNVSCTLFDDPLNQYMSAWVWR